jgi:hypothetical protein
VRAHGAPLARRCARLVALARMRGSGDDATVLALRREANDGRRQAPARSGT